MKKRFKIHATIRTTMGTLNDRNVELNWLHKAKQTREAAASVLRGCRRHLATSRLRMAQVCRGGATDHCAPAINQSRRRKRRALVSEFRL